MKVFRRDPLIVALLAMALLSAMDALIKLVTDDLRTWQIVALRYAIGTVMVVPFAWPHIRRGIPRSSWTPNLLRGALFVGTAAQFFFALSRLSLVEAAVLAFTAPLWFVLMGRLFLRELITTHALAALALGFVGVITVVLTGHSEGYDLAERLDPLGIAAGLGAAVTYALAVVMVRHRSAHDAVPVMVLIQGIAASAIAMPAAVTAWRPLSLELCVLFGLIGLLATIGHLLFAWSLKHMPVARMAPVEYSSLVWALLFGILLFEEYPSIAQLVGAAVIVVACWIVRQGRAGEP